MDTYSKKTKKWLDERFCKCDENGIYLAHQPIYGFRKGHSELGSISKYIITFSIMNTLSHLSFDSLLDVGGAEGYKAYIVKELFGVKVMNSDLSNEACKRAEEIFQLESIPADIHELPFKDNEFDVVLCSQTLEHITNPKQSIDEITRVAKKAIIITVPYESQEDIDKNIKEKSPHSHIHSFNLKSLGVCPSNNCTVFNGMV